MFITGEGKMEERTFGVGVESCHLRRSPVSDEKKHRVLANKTSQHANFQVLKRNEMYSVYTHLENGFSRRRNLLADPSLPLNFNLTGVSENGLRSIVATAIVSECNSDSEPASTPEFASATSSIVSSGVLILLVLRLVDTHLRIRYRGPAWVELEFECDVEEAAGGSARIRSMLVISASRRPYPIERLLVETRYSGAPSEVRYSASKGSFRESVSVIAPRSAASKKLFIRGRRFSILGCIQPSKQDKGG
ncbi:uncharacterized protein FOMMEDRAFT_30351 [Fomitiporia mediterranea MF3/22]|uniref:uncharacterized protein n=1 Tax=Fomitiporia mediterranea (strain MF3/22) TaxID=694068 RepID=UPI000440809F|nr:uncharacterized protein FOMMEDRAFT_30351 [Fomitiporia mediterranea MF3/22]EJD01741.1 hypothetical protein FOMMEDRAFT_30351 [Fomitiporia mediterranea MF3/22]